MEKLENVYVTQDQFMGFVEANLAGDFYVFGVDIDSDTDAWFWIRFDTPDGDYSVHLCSEVEGNKFILKQFPYASDAMRRIELELIALGIPSSYRMFVDETDLNDPVLSVKH